jgi:hypothetical protein
VLGLCQEIYMRRLLPLLVALAVLTTAVPAFADRPEPLIDPTGSCLVFVETHVPKGGKRVASVEFGQSSWTDGRFLNGTSHTFVASVSADTEIEMLMLDHRGEPVYSTTVPVTCEVDTRPPSL